MAYSFTRTIQIQATQVGASDQTNFALTFDPTRADILSEPITSTTSTGVVLTTGLQIQNADYIQIDSEIMQVIVGGQTGLLTVLRAQLGTTAGTHLAGAKVQDLLLATVANGGGVQSSSGFDIIFTSDAGGTTILDFERVYWLATGQCEFHVKVPTVLHTTATSIYLFFGNAAITTDLQNASAVWDSSYQGVYHFGSPTTLAVTDSTTNANNGTVVDNGEFGGHVLAGQGEIGGCVVCETIKNYVDLGTPFTLNAPFTIGMWINTAAPIAANANVLIGKNYDALTNGGDFHFQIEGSFGGLSRYEFKVNTSAGISTATETAFFITPAWYYTLVTYDGTNIIIYRNGASVITGTSTGTYTGNSDHLLAAGEATGSVFDSSTTIDELRISTVVRSADWVTATYNSQGSPSTFYAMLGGGGVCATPEQRGNIDFDQIRSPARQGVGTKFQMFGGGSTIPGDVPVYDECGNLIDSGFGVPRGTVQSVGVSAPPGFTVSGSPVSGSGTISITQNPQNANTVEAGPASGSPAIPTYRALVLADIPIIPLTTGVSGILPVANGGTGTASPGLVAGTNVTITGTWPDQTIAATGGGGSGTVTSVAVTVPVEFSVSGSPITGSGTIAITKANENANLVYAGPTSGSAAAPTFRAMVPADLPLATTSSFGAVKPDATTIDISLGIISVPTATTSLLGLVKPDGTTITIASGVISSASGNTFYGNASAVATGGENEGTLGSTPINNSQSLFKNGSILRLGTDYTYAGTVASLLTALSASDVIVATWATTNSTPGGLTLSAVTAYASLRGTAKYAASGATVTLTLPSGSAVGDLAIVMIGLEDNSVTISTSGWTTQNNMGGANAAGGVYSKILTSTEITNGSIGVSVLSFDTPFAALAVFVGNTGGIRETDAAQHGSSFTSPVTGPSTSGAVTNSDVLLYFTYNRGASTDSVSRGTVEQRGSAATGDGCGGCLYFEQSPSSGSITPNFIYGTPGTGYYQAVVVVKG
jgi:hypothetical protein